jgi:hypothetical protein
MKHKGKDLIINIDSVAVAMSKSCTIDVDCEILETSSPDDGDFKHVAAGQKSWQVQTTQLVAYEGTPIKDLIGKVGTAVKLTVHSRDLSSDALSGAAICAKCKITGTRGNLTQGSFTFEGNGPLS